VAAGTAALLHDVGKKNIPRDLLTKPKWTAEEVALVRKHPILGESLLKSVYTIPNKVREAILHHHENYDGSGYPNGVAGDRISEIARIIAIADAFDRLTTDWPTQKAFAADVALELMGSLQPGRFDPSIFRKFKKGTSIQTMGKSLAKDFDPCNPEVIRLVRR
jgi:HD-GYP domain-containing protein (c-di-GMP phosphodiesterase class II)